MRKQHSHHRLTGVTRVTVSGDALTQTISRIYMRPAVLDFYLSAAAFEVPCAESR
jgi:hypothetical protein